MKNNKVIYESKQSYHLLFLLTGAVFYSFFSQVNAQIIINGPEYARVKDEGTFQSSTSSLRDSFSEDLGAVNVPSADLTKEEDTRIMQTSIWNRNGKEISSTGITTVENTTGENSTYFAGTQTLQTFKLWVSQLFTVRPTLSSLGSITSSDIVSVVGKKDTTISWNANKLALGRVYYATESPLTIGSDTPWFNASNFGNYANSQAILYRLNPNTTYYYKVVLQDASGKTDTSLENSFTTK